MSGPFRFDRDVANLRDATAPVAAVAIGSAPLDLGLVSAADLAGFLPAESFDTSAGDAGRSIAAWPVPPIISDAVSPSLEPFVPGAVAR